MKARTQGASTLTVTAAEPPLLAETVAKAISPALSVSPKATGRVVMSTPVSALGALLQSGVTPGEALISWSVAAQALLAELDRSKGKLKPVFAPRQGGDIVIGRSSLRCPADAVPPWWALAAGRLIEADETARRASDTLFERAETIAPTALSEALALTADLQRLFAADSDTDEASSQLRYETRLATAIDAIDHLQAVASHQAEELTHIIEAEVEAGQDLVQLRDQLADHARLQDQVETLSNTIQRMEQSQRLREMVLGAKLLDDLAELRRLHGVIRGGEDWSRALQADVETLRAELDKVYGSKSWRLTAPLRSRGKAKLID